MKLVIINAVASTKSTTANVPEMTPVPREELLWQDPLPAVTHELIGDANILTLKSKILASGLTVSELDLPHGPQHQRSAAPTSAVGLTAHGFVSPRKRTGP